MIYFIIAISVFIVIYEIFRKPSEREAERKCIEKLRNYYNGTDTED